MVSNWPMVKIGDYCSKIGSGATPRGGSSVYQASGEICLVRSQNIYNHEFKFDGLVYIDEVAAAKLKNVVLEPNDILLNITGDSVARVCVVDDIVLPARVNQHVAIIRPIPSEFDARFLCYYLTSPYAQALLLNLASAGATRNALTKSMIENFEAPKPALEVQSSIADQLEALELKIRSNQETNQTLEQMAQALFKSWFVDFDPVFDNALASGTAVNDFPEALQKKAEQRQQVQQQIANGELDARPLPEDIQQLFPSEFEQSDEPSIGIYGWIPKGWETPYLYDLGDFINGAAYKKFEPNKNGEGLPIIKIVELKNGITGNTGFSTVNMPEKYRLSDKDILFSWSGNPDTSIDTFVWSLGDAWLNQHIFKVVPNDQCSYPFLLSLLKYLKPEFSSIARDKQTTGLGHVTVKDLKNLAVVLPQVELLEVFDKQVSPFYERAFLNMKSTSELEKARDFLLPKLISGQLQLQE